MLDAEENRRGTNGSHANVPSGTLRKSAFMM
jgi:hypothetical protein